MLCRAHHNVFQLKKQHSTMDILVIEDTTRHQQSARETLSDHELTIVGSRDEAMKLLGRQYMAKEDGEVVIKDGEFGGFDAVLSDMNLPMSKWQILGDDQYDPNELVPYGFQLALSAAMQGVDYVLVATDQNHHDGPIAASVDYMQDTTEGMGGMICHDGPHTFRLNESTCHIRFAKTIVWEEADNAYEHVRAKDWGSMLDELVEASE
jgi:CheY-like chemotaxis protein